MTRSDPVMTRSGPVTKPTEGLSVTSLKYCFDMILCSVDLPVHVVHLELAIPALVPAEACPVEPWLAETASICNFPSCQYPEIACDAAARKPVLTFLIVRSQVVIQDEILDALLLVSLRLLLRLHGHGEA